MEGKLNVSAENPIINYDDVKSQIIARLENLRDVRRGGGGHRCRLRSSALRDCEAGTATSPAMVAGRGGNVRAAVVRACWC